MKGKEKIRRRSEKSLDPSEKKPVRHYWNRIICVESEERTCSGFQREERERESMEVAVRESVEREREKLRGTPAPCGRRQSEFRELALTGRYCRVHLASVQFGSWI